MNDISALEKKVLKFKAHSEHLEKKCRELKEENQLIDKLQRELQKSNKELDRVSEELENAQFASVQSNNADEALSELKSKYGKQKELNKSLKQSYKELEYDKNRQIAYLEKENLEYLDELKTTKREIKSLKAQRHMMSVGVDDAPTEDIGSLISMKLSESKKIDVNDKENQPVQTSTRRRKTINVEASAPRPGLGAVNSNDDDAPGECTQS